MKTEELLYIEKIKQLETELQKATDSLNQFKIEQEEFLLIAAHDLQAPLRKLSTFVERLTNKLVNPTQEVKTYTERIHATVTGMRTLIDDLAVLSYVKEEVYELQKCDLNKLLQNIIEDIHSDESATITFSDLPVIEGNCIPLKHLFKNLLDNAIKFKRENNPLQITISCKQLEEKEKTDLDLPAEKKYHKIEVTDNGIGFDNQYASKIFQPFQRLHGKSEYPGSGMGLAICKKIIEKHSGIIYANSKNSNTRFILILPKTVD